MRANVRDHPADERIDHVERRDVEQHAARAGRWIRDDRSS
jgi:hypothetical protein